jgi:hypothetical protein
VSSQFPLSLRRVTIFLTSFLFSFALPVDPTSADSQSSTFFDMDTAQHLDRCMETRNQFADVKAVDSTIQVTTAEVDVVSERDSVSEDSMSTTAGTVAAKTEAAQEKLSSLDGDTDGVAVKIFRIISSYGLGHEREIMLEDLLSSTLPTISQSISRNEPIRLLLPGCRKISTTRCLLVQICEMRPG